MAGVQWWLCATRAGRSAGGRRSQRSALLNFDWEMMTYWAIVGLSHAVLYYRESQRSRAAHVAARDPAGRGAAGDAAAAAAPALPLQHAARHLGADAPRRRGRRSDADAAERPAAPHARESRPAGDPARRRSSSSWRSTSRSSRRASPIASSCASTSSPKRSTRWCRT